MGLHLPVGLESLLYRSLRGTDPDPTVVRVKLFFLSITDTPFLSLASSIFQNYALSTSLFSTENRNTAILPTSSKINPPTLEHLLEKNIAIDRPAYDNCYDIFKDNFGSMDV